MRSLRVSLVVVRMALWALIGVLPVTFSGWLKGQVVLGNFGALNGIPVSPAQTVLFTGNGALGWIGDNNRDRVVVFDPRKGTVVRVVTDVPSPGSMALSPDRRTIAVVSVGTNVLSLIDTSTFVVRVITSFQPASFDIANNVAFSPDGARAFVADYGYNNLLVFDTQTTSFVRALALPANARPGSVAVTPNGQLLAVTTTGLRSTGGNYIAVFRADSLLPFGTGRLLLNNADFSTANNILFAPNGLGYVASYGTGTLYAFDPWTFTASALAVGLGPGSITLSPNGNVLAVNNANSPSLSLVDLTARRVAATVLPSRGLMNPYSRVEFSTNGALGYFAVPTSNELIVFSAANGAIRRRLLTPGGPVQVFKNPERGLIYSLNAQARTLSVAGFVLNFPILRDNSSEFTALALSNPSDVPITVTLAPYDNNGQPLRGGGGFIARFITLAPKGQWADLVGDFFGLPPEVEGWIQMTSLDEVTSGFFLQGNTASTFLNGGTVSGIGSTRLGFTRVLEGSGTFGDPAQTELHLVNPGQSTAALDLTLYDATGQSVGTASRTIAPMNRINATISGLFPSISLPQTGGFVDITASTGITGYELVRFGASLFMLAGRDLMAIPAGSLYSAQFASGLAGDPFFTEVNLVNTGTRPVRATLRLVNDSGQAITGATVLNPVTVDLPAKGVFYGRGSQVFGLADEATDPNLTVGSIIIDTSDSGVVGDVIFGEPVRGRFISSLPMTSALATDVVFSHVAEGTAGNLTFFTGVALLNPGATDITVTVKVYTDTGRLVGSGDVPLAAGARTSRLLRDFVPASLGQIGGFVRLTATGGFSAFELFGTTVPLQFLASVPAQVLQ